jgi:hypothetical protein
MAASVEPKVLLAEIERLVQSTPPAETFYHDLPERHVWLGDVSAALHAWDTVRSVGAVMAIDRVFNIALRNNSERQAISVVLMTARRALQLSLGMTSSSYILISSTARTQLSTDLQSLRKAVNDSNSIEPETREVVLAEIAAFEATIVQPRVATDLIQRFVNSVLKGAVMKVIGATADEIAGRIAIFALGLLAAGGS